MVVLGRCWVARNPSFVVGRAIAAVAASASVRHVVTGGPSRETERERSAGSFTLRKYVPTAAAATLTLAAGCSVAGKATGIRNRAPGLTNRAV